MINAHANRKAALALAAEPMIFIVRPEGNTL
jgi:hypothetical protein